MSGKRYDELIKQIEKVLVQQQESTNKASQTLMKEFIEGSKQDTLDKYNETKTQRAITTNPILTKPYTISSNSFNCVAPYRS